MIKLVLGLVLLLNSNMLLASFLPRGSVCQARGGSLYFTLTIESEEILENVGCYRVEYVGSKNSFGGIACISSQMMFLSFPQGDEWSCKPNYQTRNWECSGVGTLSRNKRFYLRCP